MDSGQPGSGALSPRSGPTRLGSKELNQSNDSLLDTGGTTGSNYAPSKYTLSSVDSGLYLRGSGSWSGVRNCVQDEPVLMGSGFAGGSPGVPDRTSVLEKEVLESQIRKMQIENSKLQTENKMLKEKFNRAQAKINDLESQLETAHEDLDIMARQHEAEISSFKKNSREHSELERQDLQSQIVALTKSLEMAEAEKASIEKQAEMARMAVDRARVSSEKSGIIASFRTEVATLKEEMRKVKLLQKQAEKDREEETERRKDLSTQVIKLTEVKSLLQDQIQNASGGTAADKQARAMERRLRITEDRLHQERADRAMKLSQIEEKLIKENAKLQVAEKEMKRQLQRERDRHRALEVKYREMKEESQRLQGLLADRPASTIEDAAFNHKLNSIRAGITSKKLVQDERQMYEERIATYKDNLEDISNEKEDQDKILNTRVKDLTAEKHSNHSRIKNLEDMVEAVQAENDSLRDAVKSAYKPSQMKPAQPSSVPAQLEHLNSELHTAKLSINYKERAIKLLEGELETLRAQEQAKSQALKETLDELEHFSNSHLVDSSVTKTKQEQINKLRAEIKGLQAELSHTRDKYHRALYERTQLEEKLVPRSKRKQENREAGEQRRSKLYKIDREVLEKEVHEKDSQVMTLTLQYNDTEDQLQRTKKKLHLQEEHAEHLKAQVDQIQNQLWQKARTMEHISGTSNEHEVELRTMRETLASVNSDLTQAQTEVKLKTVELNHERSKTEKLREDVHRRDDILSKGVAQATRDGELDSVLFQEADTPQQVLHEADNKYRKVDFENEQLKHELQTVKETLSTMLTENGQLTGTVREIKQDLVQERAHISHSTSQQTSLQHQLQLCTQERDTCQLENDKLVADLARHEKETKQAVHKLMEESQKSQIEVETLYHKFGPEGKQVALELGTLRRLVEAREKEIEFLRGTINHQREELSSSKRQVEILKEENQASRDNIERLNTEIRVKVKETSGTQEANQMLSTERTKIEMEKLQLERGLDRERSQMERRGMEVQDYKKKLDKAEEKYHQLEQAHHEKNTALAKAETELRHMTKNAKQLEHDRDDLKAQLEKFNYEVRCLSNINSSLEERLVAEKSTLSDTRGSKDLLKDDLTTAIRQVELFRREYQILTTNLETERSTTRTLKEQCQQEEEKNFHLEDRVKTQELENVTLKTQINESRNLIEQYKHDKQNLYQDIQELGQKVASKDELIAKLQEKCDETVTSIQKDLQQEKEEYKKTRSELESDLNKARNQVDTLNERLRTKEIQLEGFKTMQTDLETEIKLRQEAETKNESLGTELNSTKHQLGTLRVEYGGVTDQSQQLKKSLDESKSLVTTLKEQMRNLRDDNAKEVHNLRTSLTEATHKHEREKSELQEKLSKAEGSLKANEVALEGLKETKERLQTSVKTFEQTVESLKSQLHEENTTRKLAQQKVESLKTQIDDIQQTRVGFEEKVAENKAQIAKLETELAIEKDKCKRLKLQNTDLQSANQTNEAHAQALEMQVAELESENQSLTSHVENLKQGLQGKSKKTALDLKQQAETFESERSKLISQANQLAVDLEHAREQVALKNRDNLQLQENLLAVQEKIQDTENKYKRIQESLRAEEELRLRVDERNQELELEMAKNRGRRGSLDDTLSEHSEISKVMADMSKRMQDHLDQQRDAERDALSKEQNKVEDLKRKLASLESALNKEQAMHMVTQTSLDSFREDNQRLRQQLQSLKKKTNTQSSEERTKSRMEEINEIIARSQTRAQQLLASGVYGDDPFRTLNASRDFSSTMPIMPVFVSTPPNEARSLDGDRSHLSDDLNSSFNLSSGLLDVPKYSKK